MINEATGLAEAEQLLEELGIDTLPIVPSEIVDAISSHDCKVVLEYHPFSSTDFLGKAEGRSDSALIYINSNIPSAGRRNFTAAHEIGHVCMHILTSQKQKFSCGSQELTNPFNDPFEQQANGFASGLLMPKPLLVRISSGILDWKNIHRVSQACETSLEATYRRMALLEKAPHAFVIHKHGKMQRFTATDNFDFYIEKSPLSHEQKSYCVDVAEDGFPEDFDQTDAEDWVNPISRDYKLEKIYSSSILLSDGYTYTILSYDDDCFEDQG